MDPYATPADLILDAALEQAGKVGWEAVHLHQLAEQLGLTLADIHRAYPTKDALAEAWFDRAEAALLAIAHTPGWPALPVPERLCRAICAWLDALAPHRETTRAMLRYKLQPEHLHLQALGAVRVSRTVQCICEVARLSDTGWRRELAEAALTTLYLATLSHWLYDESPGAQRTRERLRRGLALLGRAAGPLGFGR